MDSEDSQLDILDIDPEIVTDLISLIFIILYGEAEEDQPMK